MQATQLPEPAAVPVQRPASPALAPALRTISGETPHYRARFEVAAADGADAAEAVKEIVMGWLHAKGLDVPEGAADIAVPAGWTAADEPDAAKAVRFLGLSGAQGAAWAVEADELDGEFSRRRWHTRIGLAPAGDGGCILNVQVSHYAVNGFFGYQRNPLPSVPRVVRDILANGKLDVRIGASRVSVEEIYLDADTLKRNFMSSLTDRARCLPIVLMTTDDDGKTPVWDATELASKLVGMATVYVIDMRDGALVQAFRDLLPDRTPAGRYRIGRSAVMVYRPGIDLSGEESLSACTLFTRHRIGRSAVMVYRPGIDLSGEESLSACTLFTRHRIERYAAGGRDGFINVLMQGLGRGIDARPGDVAGIGDVLWLRSRVESERLRSRAKAAAEPVADIDGLRAENARLRADAEAWEEIATDQERSYSDATAKVDELTRTVQRLEGEKRALERKAAQCAAPSDDDGAARVAECLQSIPRDLTDLLKLARSIWPERIVVLPEAMDSAKSYDGNLAEEWDIVRSTATALYGLLFEDDGCEGQVADEFQRRTGYELTFSESSATRARADLMKMRERSYGGRTVDISAHIKGRSQKNTFRLHFYIDRENELIVIGHAGCHMKTAGSHRRGFK